MGGAKESGCREDGEERESAATVKGSRGAREKKGKSERGKRRAGGRLGGRFFGQRCQATGIGGETIGNCIIAN